MKENLDDYLLELENEGKNVKTFAELSNLKARYFAKSGIINELNSRMKDLPVDKKKDYGIELNKFKNAINQAIEKIKNSLEEDLLNSKIKTDTIDISLPSTKIKRGSKHPLSRIEEKFEDLFTSMGYTIYDGPELESDENCFQKLNVAKGHAARDAQDTFYLDKEFENFLLRTQTSAGQVRAMEESVQKGPLKIICPGKVYRRDEDATHSHQFMQCEGLVIDENISMADLKGTLELFVKEFLGEKTEVRFRPSFFPFTEPSVEVDVTCFKCGGKGCPLCKKTGFIEVLGAGMVHPNVLEMCGYDSKKYQAFAFGTGMDRFAMFRYGINDIRILYANDIRFLEQFDRKEVN